MRKVFATILAFFYLVSATGINVHMHYCMDMMNGVGLIGENSAVCSVCGMDKTGNESGCCKDETKFLKNTSDQQNSEINIQLKQITWAVLPLLFLNSPFAFTAIHKSAQHFDTFINRNSSPPVYLLNCVFRI